MPQELEQKSPNQGVQLQFSQIVTFFAAYLGLAPDVVETRVRLLRRAGVPMLEAMKTGPAKHYGLPQLVQLTFAMEFVEEGISMSEAASIVRHFWASHLAKAPDTAWRQQDKGSEDAVLVVLYRSSFRGWGPAVRKDQWRYITPNLDDGEKYAIAHTMEVIAASQFIQSSFFSTRLQVPSSYGRHRAYILNCSKLAQTIGHLLVSQDVVQPTVGKQLYRRYRPFESD